MEGYEGEAPAEEPLAPPGSEPVSSFSQLRDKTNQILADTVDVVLAKATWSNKSVKEWSDKISTTALDKLQMQSEKFKYIVSTVIIQKNGAGMNFNAACFWDQATDGCVTYRWENKSMHCVVSVYGLAV
jgi:dynein light chain Tctex-type 1